MTPDQQTIIVVAELIPGAAAASEALAQTAGGWVCERHPDQPWQHNGCDAPAMFANDAERRP
jgi:hypothetical protein